MLLVEFNIGGTTNYLSNEDIALDHFWDGKVISFDSPQIGIDSKYGGYVKPKFGGISFSQDLFTAGNWVPPTSAQIAIRYTGSTSTETSAVTLFIGTAYLKDIRREEITYGLFGEQVGGGGTIASGTNYSYVSLESVFNSCATTLGLTVNYSLARSSSTKVKHQVSGDQEILSFLSNLSSFYTHLFYINGTSLYLVDMFQDNGVTTITEFDYFPSNYNFNTPTIFKSGTSVVGGTTYPYGQDSSITPYSSDSDHIYTALNNTWDIHHKLFTNLRIPFIEPLPTTPGLRVQWIDEAQQHDVSAYLRVRSIIYNFNQEEIVLIGEGEIESG